MGGGKNTFEEMRSSGFRQLCGPAGAVNVSDLDVAYDTLLRAQHWGT